MFIIFFIFTNQKNVYEIKKYTNENIEPFKEIKVNNKTYKFYKKDTDPKKKFIKISAAILIKNLINMKPIVYEDTYKLTIIPFKSITIEKDQNLSLGVHVKTFFKGKNLIQSFEGGSVCDLNKKIKWSSDVIYLITDGEPRIHRIFEKSLCKYEIIVKGSVFGKEVSVNEFYIDFWNENFDKYFLSNENKVSVNKKNDLFFEIKVDNDY